MQMHRRGKAKCFAASQVEKGQNWWRQPMAKASRNQAQWLPITVYTWRRYKCRCDNCTAPIDACGVPSVHLSMTSKYQIGPGLSAGNSATALMAHLKLLVGTTLAVVCSRNTPLQDQCCITISLDSCRSMLKQAISPSISYSGDKKRGSQHL